MNGNRITYADCSQSTTGVTVFVLHVYVFCKECHGYYDMNFVPARVLKEAAAEIAPIITHVFQQSYNTSKLPDDWLQALATPIHKKSLKSDPANCDGAHYP